MRSVLITASFICFFSATYSQGWVMSDDFFEIYEDEADVVLDVLENDDNLTTETSAYLEILSPPEYGTVVIDDVNDVVIYTPDEDFTGFDDFTYNACAFTVPVQCDSANALISVQPAADAPIAVDDYIITYTSDASVIIELLLNDIDVDGEGVEFTIIADVNNGETTPIDGEYIFYEPFPSDFIGEDSIIYELCKIGSDVLCDTATIYINRQSANFNIPIAQNDTVTVSIDGSVDIAVIENDFDGDDDELVIAELIIGGATGEVFITGSNTLNYTPATIGSDEFLYVVCDDGAPSFCDTALVYVIVTNTTVTGPGLSVPNSFSPNNDGINDVLQIEGLNDYPGVNLKIFNRWSSLIFESTDPDHMWNGKSNVEFLSTSGDVPEGTYYYILYLEGLIDPLTGFIVVKR